MRLQVFWREDKEMQKRIMLLFVWPVEFLMASLADYPYREDFSFSLSPGMTLLLWAVSADLTTTLQAVVFTFLLATGWGKVT